MNIPCHTRMQCAGTALVLGHVVQLLGSRGALVYVGGSQMTAVWVSIW